MSLFEDMELISMFMLLLPPVELLASDIIPVDVSLTLDVNL